MNTSTLCPSVGQMRGTAYILLEGVDGGDLLPLGFLPSDPPHNRPSPRFVLLGVSSQRN